MHMYIYLFIYNPTCFSQTAFREEIVLDYLLNFTDFLFRKSGVDSKNYTPKLCAVISSKSVGRFMSQSEFP